MENRPIAAYTLAMVGVAFQAIAALFVILKAALSTTVGIGWYTMPPDWMAPWGMGYWMQGLPYTRHPILAVVWAVSAIVIFALGIYGAVLMNSTNIGRVRMGSVMVLVVSMIAFPTMWGFFTGSLLMFVGSLVGLIWLPSQPPQTA